MKTLAAVLVLALVALVNADMYFHNPRGANNRLDEARRDRNNANRLYDSQNNNRGGYNVGSLYYYEGSILSLEWTNQHSCGDQNNNCEIIIQYMCGDLVRDGATTRTIPDNPAQCDDFNCNEDLEFGMHENFDYYLDCKLRQRNTGLFLADRDLRGDTAIYTRQNQDGTRRGYECPEERDYYPYWHPTPWTDIVVFTNDVSRCGYYRRESQNVKSRFACVLPDEIINENLRRRIAVIPNEQEECNSTCIENDFGNLTCGEWREFLPAPGLSAPECVESLWSRDNHLGNTVGGFPINYNWTVPNTPHEHCVLRIRYNISTGEYDGFNPAVNSSIQQLRNQEVFDGANGIRRRDISELDVSSQFGLSQEDAYRRGYVFRQNPVVKVFDDVNDSGRGIGLQLAVNTNQFGRTFQDRSHTFAIRERPEDLQDATIYNLNVRGKRGNIVQVYPGVEYDFVPNTLLMSVNSYVHIQWTGSNTNPNNNDGQGQAGTDRSNIILLREQNYTEGNGVDVEPGFGYLGRSYPANLNNDETFLGLSREDRQALAVLDNVQFGGEMSELDDAGTYFDLGPRKVTQRGTYHYMCSRNNNFTNRSQKGKVIVIDNALSFARIGEVGGVVRINNHFVNIEGGDLEEPVVFRMEEYANANDAVNSVDMQAAEGRNIREPSNTVSAYVLLEPIEQFTANDEMVEIHIDTSGESDQTKIYRATQQSSWVFEELSTRVSGGMAVASTDQGGVFVAASGPNTALIIGLSVFGVFMFILILVVGGVVIYFVVRRDKWQATKDNVRKAKMKLTRSFAKQV